MRRRAEAVAAFAALAACGQSTHSSTPVAMSASAPSTPPGPSSSAPLVFVNAAAPRVATRVALESPKELIELPPAGLSPVTFGESEAAFVLEDAASAEPTAWLVADAIRLRPGLYASRVVRSDPAAAGVIVWSPGGPVVRVDADAVLASDRDATTVLARKGDTPLLLKLPATFDGTPPTLRALESPADPKWAEGPMEMLDDAHVLVAQTIVRALPSLDAVASWTAPPIAVAARTALFEAMNKRGERYFDVVDALTGAQRLALPPPTAQLVDMARSMFDGPAYVANLSPDGTRVAYADSTGLWLADVSAKTPTWKSVSTKPFGSYRGAYGVAVAQDNRFVCLTANGNAAIFPVTGSPAPRASTVAVALPSGYVAGSGPCEVVYLPVIAGLDPLPYVNDKFYSMIEPWLLDPDRRWMIALHQDAKGSVELVLSEPATGKLVRRVPVLEHPPPAPDGEPTMRTMMVSPGPPGFARASVTFDSTTREVLVDVATGDVVALADVPRGKWTGTHCLHDDGSLTPSATCDPAR